MADRSTAMLGRRQEGGSQLAGGHRRGAEARSTLGRMEAKPAPQEGGRQVNGRRSGFVPGASEVSALHSSGPAQLPAHHRTPTCQAAATESMADLSGCAFPFSAALPLPLPLPVPHRSPWATIQPGSLSSNLAFPGSLFSDYSVSECPTVALGRAGKATKAHAELETELSPAKRPLPTPCDAAPAIRRKAQKSKAAEAMTTPCDGNFLPLGMMMHALDASRRSAKMPRGGKV